MMGALREGVLVGSGAVGCLPYPSHLSAPVTLTLTLSRRAGEGIFPSPPFPFGWTGSVLQAAGLRWDDVGVRCLRLF